MPNGYERFRHLLLAGTARSLPYTQRGGGRPRGGYPHRNPDEHGRELSAELAAIRATQAELLDRRRSQEFLDVTGSEVTFELVLNPHLKLESLEDQRAGIELLAFRKTGDEIGTASVFVPEGKLQVFEKKLAAYLDAENLTIKGNRKHESLINSIERIRRTVLGDLWTDPLREFPAEGGMLWWEIWVRNQAGVDRFREHARRLEIVTGERTLRFPDRSVLLAHASVEQMTLSVELLDSIAELREARSLAVEFLQMEHREEREQIDRFRSNVESPLSNYPVVCLLDTGVDVGHPLLEPGLKAEDAHAYDENNWGTDDHHGHGTQMAGIALYGETLDSLILAGRPVELRHGLESVKILPRIGSNPPELYGEITLSAAALAETYNGTRLRDFCLSVTSSRCPEGRPTSWSGAMDQLCAGAEEEGHPPRLVFVSSGNANTAAGYSYPDSNHTDCLQDPAQAWNPVTVGAYTERILIQEEDCRDWEVVAPAGDMSPSNTTSLLWREPWTNKPDLVLEGGNMAWEPASGAADPLESLSLLTTRRRQDGSGLLAWTGDTSAATAAAARLGILILAEYPELWPETIRALLVHSGRWTSAMEARFANLPPRERIDRALRCYGFGIPDLNRALRSLRHQLTLVVQETIQPFRLDRSRGRTEARSNEMHLHRIPWPADVLASLGEVRVRMRVTLSYFIEPKPGQRGKSQRYRYASHGLRFDVKTAAESEEEFLVRINLALREEDEEPSFSRSDSREWTIGPQSRNRGSIHSDVWVGSAADLASKDAVAVYPVIGWWRDPKRVDRCERSVRYALVVSIESDAAEVEIEGVTVPVDFYTEVVNAIEVSNEIEIIGM
ncbi:MAG TPA: S8 family peptidase [Thermoanaerobaculia bacterium]